jgi:hypothetical protein
VSFEFAETPAEHLGNEVDDAMKMQVGIEAGTETVNEGHRTEACRCT